MSELYDQETESKIQIELEKIERRILNIVLFSVVLAEVLTTIGILIHHVSLAYKLSELAIQAVVTAIIASVLLSVLNGMKK